MTDNLEQALQAPSAAQGIFRRVLPLLVILAGLAAFFYGALFNSHEVLVPKQSAPTASPADSTPAKNANVPESDNAEAPGEAAAPAGQAEAPAVTEPLELPASAPGFAAITPPPGFEPFVHADQVEASAPASEAEATAQVDLPELPASAPGFAAITPPPGFEPFVPAAPDEVSAPAANAQVKEQRSASAESAAPESASAPTDTVIKSEPEIIRDVTVGGLILLADGKMKQTYGDKPASVCPT